MPLAGFGSGCCVILLLGNWPRILARTSSGSGASSTVEDCLKEEPLVFFAEARSEDDESFETRDKVEDPLVLIPGLWGARYGPRELVRWGSGETERLLFGGAALPGCWPGRRSSHIANQAQLQARREGHAGAAGNRYGTRSHRWARKAVVVGVVVLCHMLKNVGFGRGPSCHSPSQLRCLQETLGIVECAPVWLGKWMNGASNWRQRHSWVQGARHKAGQATRRLGVAARACADHPLGALPSRQPTLLVPSRVGIFTYILQAVYLLITPFCNNLIILNRIAS